MWIFGYGSLVWKVDFPYEEKVIGYIKGYKRRFWQASIDHRGVPEKPGRVVTLVESENSEDKLWGVAYRVCKEVMSPGGQLDVREQRYTKRINVPFFLKCETKLDSPVLVFVSTKDDALFLGPASLEDMIKQISSSHGPSGSNEEYVFNLADFVRNEAPHSQLDEELFQIECGLKSIKKS